MKYPEPGCTGRTAPPATASTAKGFGPVAPALKMPVCDLTLIARRNKGDHFRDNESPDESILKLREHNPTEYIRSIQKK